MQDMLLITDGSVAMALSPAASVLRYEFRDEQRDDYLTAWQIEADSLAVTIGSRALNGGFRQQALNRPVAQKVMQARFKAVVLVGLHGCTVDLPRVLHLLGVSVIWVIPPSASLQDIDDAGRACLMDSLGKCAGVCDPAAVLGDISVHRKLAMDEVDACLHSLVDAGDQSGIRHYDYSLYEFSQRDHPLLCLFQEQDVRHFHGCRRVLDLGCGVGIFLALLQAESITATGVERNPALVDYGRGMGLDLVQADALEFLETTCERFDGIYCSHFVEHLPVELVQRLLRGLARVLDEDGLVVLAFPDPESIRAQLFGFWRDPEHVRFYHPDLVASLALVENLVCEWSSYQEQPHHMTFFPLVPPVLSPLPEAALADPVAPGLLARVWRWLGLADHGQLAQLTARLQTQQDMISAQQQVIRELAERSEQLWAVNNTWGWRDTVVLKLRKRSICK